MLMKILQFLIGSWCNHHWGIHSHNDVASDGAKIGEKYILQCMKCGNLKVKRCYA